jgi:hypothetical protein
MSPPGGRIADVKNWLGAKFPLMQGGTYITGSWEILWSSHVFLKKKRFGWASSLCLKTWLCKTSQTRIRRNGGLPSSSTASDEYWLMISWVDSKINLKIGQFTLQPKLFWSWKRFVCWCTDFVGSSVVRVENWFGLMSDTKTLAQVSTKECNPLPLGLHNKYCYM